MTDHIPHDIEAEVCTLGSMILAPDDVIFKARQIVQADDFYSAEHQALFGVLVEMHEADTKIDLVAIRHELERRGLLAKMREGYVEDIVDGVPGAGNAEYYAGIVRDKSQLRALLSLGLKLQAEARAHDADVDGLVNQAEADLIRIDTRDRDESAADLSDAAEAVLERAEAVQQGQATSGLRTGFAGIDNAIGGMKPGHLVTLAAGTSVGKSAMAVCVARKVAKAGGKVLFVSGEMSTEEIGQRFLQVHARIPGWRIDRGDLIGHWEPLKAAGAEFTQWRVRIYGRAATVGQIGALARKLALEWHSKLDLVVVDYLQLMDPPPDIPARHRERQVSEMARRLKQLAGDLGLPILMLCQLNREFLQNNRPPELHHLRESGAIEQHSNTVVLLHTPPAKYLNPTPGSGEHAIWAKVAKARSGSTTYWPQPGDDQQRNTIILRFTPAETRFGGATREEPIPTA